LKPNEKLLKSAGLHQARPGLWSRVGTHELLSRIAAADIVISDLDECMYPTITQGLAGLIFVRRIFQAPFVETHRELIPNLLYRTVQIAASKIYQEISGDVQNSRLIRAFEKFARGVPIDYFTDATDEFKDKYYKGMPEALGAFSSRGVPVGVISLGIDIVIRPLLERIEATKGAKFSFFDCTHCLADERGGFDRFLPEKTYTKNDDKLYLVRGRCEEYGAKRCLVIGHDRDDLKMLAEARRLGGTTVGFNPVSEVYPHLDTAVFAPDWRPMASLFEEALREKSVL
jgi:phosphoserine phosphatase